MWWSSIWVSCGVGNQNEICYTSFRVDEQYEISCEMSEIKHAYRHKLVILH